MKALRIFATGDCDVISLDRLAPETSIATHIGGPVDVTSLSPLAAHLDLWTLCDPLVAHRNPVPNDIASVIASYRARPARIYGTALIVGHTDSGLITSLGPNDLDALSRIVAEIRAGWSPSQAYSEAG